MIGKIDEFQWILSRMAKPEFVGSFIFLVENQIFEPNDVAVLWMRLFVGSTLWALRDEKLYVTNNTVRGLVLNKIGLNQQPTRQDDFVSCLNKLIICLEKACLEASSIEPFQRVGIIIWMSLNVRVGSMCFFI